MKRKESGCLKSVWTTLIVPILVGIIIAYLAGRVVIRISGFQLSIGLTIAITCIFFVVIVISFLLGVGYLLFAGMSLLSRTDMPLVYRLATRFVLNPALWVYSRFFVSKEDREADRQDLAEAKAALAEYHKRVDRELKRIKNEPPTPGTH